MIHLLVDTLFGLVDALFVLVDAPFPLARFVDAH
jgi:hypothetical protein